MNILWYYFNIERTVWERAFYICAVISSKVIGLIDTKPDQFKYKKGSFRLRLNPDAVRSLSKNLLWMY